MIVGMNSYSETASYRPRSLRAGESVSIIKFMRLKSWSYNSGLELSLKLMFDDWGGEG